MRRATFRLSAFSQKKRRERSSAAAPIEALERRLLFDVQVNVPSLDTVVSGTPEVTQNQASHLLYTPAGSNVPALLVGYNDTALRQFETSGFNDPHHGDGWSISTDGGATFSRSAEQLHLP